MFDASRSISGASAGAGSGEFDIYRGCRRRQIIREAFLTREAKEVRPDDSQFNGNRTLRLLLLERSQCPMVSEGGKR